MKRRLLVYVMLCTSTVFCMGFHWWDPVAKWIGIGNKAYQEGDSESAQEAYKKAEEVNPDSPAIQNNMGTVLYKQEDIESALKRFDRAIAGDDPDVKAQALYNKGCVQMNMGRMNEAIQSFKESLLLNPQDEDAKVNLEIARKMVEMMPSPTPPQQNQQSDENSEDDSQEEGTPPPQTPNPSPNASTPQPQSAPAASPTPQPSPESSESAGAEAGEPTPTPGQMPEEVEEGMMSQAEAERLLDALEEDEMEVLKRFHRLPEVDEKDIEKDW